MKRPPELWKMILDPQNPDFSPNHRLFSMILPIFPWRDGQVGPGCLGRIWRRYHEPSQYSPRSTSSNFVDVTHDVTTRPGRHPQLEANQNCSRYSHSLVREVRSVYSRTLDTVLARTCKRLSQHFILQRTRQCLQNKAAALQQSL